MNDCNELLDELMKNVGNTQMEREEYSYIASFLEGGVNFLVFGTGYDSDYWRCCNQSGITLFLENDDQWIDRTKSDILKIDYTTTRDQHKDLLEDYKSGGNDLLVDLPESVLLTNWDAIFVDSPVGNSDETPGRMQSIYAAYRLSTKNTDVFVHDCNREVENLYTSFFFSEVKTLSKLRHVKI